MIVGILTTPTPHHLHFVRAIAEIWPSASVLLETTSVEPVFDTRHAFEDERDEFERAAFGSGEASAFETIAPTISVDHINDPATPDWLRQLNPDVMVVFGTRILSQPVLEAGPAMKYNLHGGDPEHYRGLDSHLWSIYHGDRRGLVTTLHEVSASVDDGPIVSRQALDVADRALAELRAINTEACVELTLAALDRIARDGSVASLPQRTQGRYYSFMPAVLKETCRRRYEEARWRV